MLPNFQLNLASNIRNNMIEISGVSRANGGLLKQISGSLTTDIVVEHIPTSQISDVPGQADYDVKIDPCELVTFALSWENVRDELDVVLVTPTGDIITRNSLPSNVELISSPNRPYIGLRINQPITGTWHIVIRAVKKLAGKIAYFQLFVFGENHRISGGIIVTKRFYDPGDVIPLRFQCYYDIPITGLNVTGKVRLPDGTDGAIIAFTDDEKKDPRAGKPGNGLYSGVLADTLMPGTYTIIVTADNSEGSAIYTNGDNTSQIPPFQRDYTITLSIGEPPVRRIEAEPNNGYPGGKLQTLVKGSLTHFRQGPTTFDFGEGITVNDVQIKDDLTALVTLSIKGTATFGERSITATTGNETVKTEESFQVVPRKWIWTDKWIIRLLLLIIILLLIVILIMSILLLQSP